ncbi:endoplasmic reticulum vesicle transporter-domain-containing protein [Phlebopus sp. FC_14]|nr:endoplasmic reticulum vesicle transporter-domain-containing protein [Phlebopus sp. FC_14]
MAAAKEQSLLDKLDVAVPLAQFDAFPKLPSTYKSRSESRGFLTLFVALLAFLLVLNDLGEYIWGWPDYEFSVDTQASSFMNVNVDLVVNMPCQFLSVDLRDVVGDRLFLSKGFHRDGTVFDIGQATSLKQHAQALSARQVVAQSRKSRGFFSMFRRSEPDFRPTYNHKSDGDACRIYGSLTVKKLTANLHITTLGHGYNSQMHVPHEKMNLSHVITEFSFGPYFPDISQPLDYSFEVARDPFMAYQYFLHVVPTTYVAPRTKPLDTNQYSVTHYTRKLEDHSGTPGIYFKFDLDPMVITIHQRTTSFVQLMIRCVGVIGGVFTCTSYFLRVTVRAVEAVSGADNTPGIVAAEATGVRRKWAGGHLRARSTASQSGRVIRQGSGWVVEGSSSPYASYANTPVSGGFQPQTPYPYSPYLSSPAPPPGSVPPTPNAGVGLGLASPAFGPTRGHGHAPSSSFSGRPLSGRSVSGGSPFPPRSPSMGPPPSPGGRAVSSPPMPPGGKKDD